MKPAWRGVLMPDGSIWAWPMLVLDHKTAFQHFSCLRKYKIRWRQWEAGGPIDYDEDPSVEDSDRIEAWVKAASA